jgi:phage terminase small subunit
VVVVSRERPQLGDFRMNRKKPLAIVRAEGNPGKRKLPKVDEEVTAVPGAPLCPGWLDKIAGEEWARIVPLLDAQGTLAQVDMAVIAGYCNAYSMAAKYKKSSDKSDQNLSVKYFQLMLKCASMLGISPSDRARLSVPGKEKDDEFDDLIKDAK